MSEAAFYNENEPYAVEWLRNLVGAGHIAPGVVEPRSIRDLKAKDLEGYRQAHFFAGLGGWSYALRLAGWPDEVPVFTGSCPCQPFSQAGRRKGEADERHLWPAWFKLIRKCRPGIIFGEQIAGPDGLRWLDLVHSDLERAGYAVGAADTCAACVGAPHIRQRLYFVAISREQRRKGFGVHLRAGQSRPAELEAARSGSARELALTSSTRLGRAKDRRADQGDARTSAKAKKRGSAGDPKPERDDAASKLGDTGRTRGGRDTRAVSRAEAQSDPERRAARGLVDQPLTTSSARKLGDATSRASNGRLCEQQDAQDLYRKPSRPSGQRAAPSSPWSDIEWIPCTDGKSRPVGSEIFPLAHGVPARVGKLRAAGNAIVPQQAALFIRAVMPLVGLKPAG